MDMMMSWNGSILHIIDSLWGESTGHKGPVMQNFYISTVVKLNKLLNKQSICQSFELPWCSCVVIVMNRLCNFCRQSWFPGKIPFYQVIRPHACHFFQGWYIIYLTHWSRVTHICVDKLTTIGSDNGLSPRRLQAIIWTNAGILLIRPWGTNSNEFLFKLQHFLLKKMRLKMLSGKWQPFFVSLNVLTLWPKCQKAFKWCWSFWFSLNPSSSSKLKLKELVIIVITYWHLHPKNMKLLFELKSCFLVRICASKSICLVGSAWPSKC